MAKWKRSRRGSRAARRFDDDTLVERKANSSPTSSPSVERLCKRVAEVVETRLTACNEPELEGYRVAGVAPISGVKVLMVAITPLSNEMPADPSLAMAAAQRASSYLRSEVAAALCRKQAPQLRLLVVPPQWQGAQ